MTIREGSYLRVVLGQQDTVQAYLNGSFEIKGKLSESSEIKAPRIDFEGLFVSNQTPFFHVKSFVINKGGNSGGGLGKFAFSIKGRPEILTDPNSQQIKRIIFRGVTLDLGDLLNNNNSSVSADIGLRFLVADKDGKQKWYNNGALNEVIARS